MQPKIDPEFKALLAPLTKEEYAGLEESILERGCLDTIKTWNDYIIDGHNRFSICMRHGLLFDTEPLDFDTRDDVITWMIRNQLNRRNQTPEQISYFRGKLYEQMKKAEGGNQRPLGHNAPVVSERTSAKVAEQYGVDEKTIRRDADYAKAVDTIAEHAGDDVKQQILSGELPVTKKDVIQIRKLPEEKKQEVIQSITTQQAKPHVSHNSGNNEWYTPFEFIDAAREVMGTIDLDPASCELANQTVQAGKFFDIDDNGLAHVWEGNVWLNPPYSSDLIRQFINRLVDAVTNQEITSAILLVNNATETGWFQQAASHATAICFPKGRIRYIDSEGKPANTPLQGQAFVYFGQSHKKFANVFSQFGLVVYV